MTNIDHDNETKKVIPMDSSGAEGAVDAISEDEVLALPAEATNASQAMPIPNSDVSDTQQIASGQMPDDPGQQPFVPPLNVTPSKSSSKLNDLMAAIGEKVGTLLSTKNGCIGVGAAVAALVLACLFSTHVICFHTWSEPTCTEPAICSVCGRTKGDALGHEWKEATCTTPKTCDICGETEGRALGHGVTKWSVTKEASCTEVGMESGKCERCGETQTREMPMVDHTFGEWETTKEASCTATGERTRTCKVCGEKETESIAKVNHVFGDWETTKAATCTTEGESTRTCKSCGKTESKPIVKTDHTPSDWKVVQDVTVTKNGDVIDGRRARVCTVCGVELETEKYTLSLTTSQKNALRTAASYLNYTAFSYDGLVHQLEYEGYSNEDATFAADHCGADWREQAQACAKSYLKYSAFSYSGLVDQLEYEGFSNADAVYAADNCGANWNEQAAKSAESYLRFMGFSRDGLIDQLIYEGFTYDQAVYGVNAVGL